jgi:hypothetical protein
MSYYYEYSFVSPEPTYSLVKLEFKSYFDTGAVNDTLFPIWTEMCLKKLGRSSYPIIPSLLKISNFNTQLPDDFYAAREVWSCAPFTKEYQLPSAVYNQITDSGVAIGNTNMVPACDTSLRLDNSDVFCAPCDECSYPGLIHAIYKTTNTILFTYQRSCLLTPGNIDSSCPQDLWCANKGSHTAESYDIRDNKIYTSFPIGTLYMIYYSLASDDVGNQLIPDNVWIKEYIERYLKEKTMEALLNQATDESYRQLTEKYALYKSKADESYVLADTETKKKDIFGIKRMKDKTLRRNRKYEIR